MERRDARAAIILGNDAILAARPSTTAQVAHACGAAGFDIIVPPSWGDELVARACLDQLPIHSEAAVVFCACDRVRALLPTPSREGAVQFGSVSIVSPPVAAARYLRLFYGDALLVTYVGDCPSAVDPSIDARFSPAGFLASLHRQGISLSAQPNEATAAEADRWRRYESAPGGLPARRYLARAPIDRVVREIDAPVGSLTIPVSRAKIVIDLARGAGCHCAADRERIEEGEPSRSLVPIIVAPGTLDLSPEPSAPRARQTLRARREHEPTGAEAVSPSSGGPPLFPAAAPTAPGELPATTTARAAGPSGVAPLASKPRDSMRRVHDGPRDVSMAGQWPLRRRMITLLVLPAVVLGAVTALGLAMYAGYARNAAPHVEPVRRGPESFPQSDSAGRKVSASGELDSARVSGPGGGADSIAAANARARARVDSQTIGTAPTSPSDSAAQGLRERARRMRRARAPEVVPGWLPQGQRRFTPIDTGALRPPDSTRRARPDTTPRT